jgi:hypothetical protein
LNPLVAGVAARDRLLGNRIGSPRLPEEFTIMHGAGDRVTDLAYDIVLIDDDLDFAGVPLSVRAFLWRIHRIDRQFGIDRDWIF